MAKIPKVALVFLVFLALPFVSQAATLSFSPSSGVFSNGENFTVGVYVGTDAPMNAVYGSISFPTEYLEVIKIVNNGNSIVDLWVQKPSFSNAGSLGNVRFEGVVLSPGFSDTSGRIIDITFRVRKEGSADLNFSGFSVLANDGFGTNLPVSVNTASFTMRGEVLPIKKEVAREDLQKIEAKIKAVEGQIKTLSPTGGVSIPVVGNGTEILFAIWRELPLWLRVLVAIFLGIASISILLILLGLVLVLLLWTWSFINKHKKEFISGTSLFINRTIRKFGWAVRSSKEEIRGDINFSVSKISREFKEIMENDSITQAVGHFFSLVWDIIKRFLTKNRKF